MITWECWEVMLKSSFADDATDDAAVKAEEDAAIKAVSDGIKELAKKIEDEHPRFRIEVK